MRRRSTAATCDAPHGTRYEDLCSTAAALYGCQHRRRRASKDGGRGHDVDDDGHDQRLVRGEDADVLPAVLKVALHPAAAGLLDPQVLSELDHPHRPLPDLVGVGRAEQLHQSVGLDHRGDHADVNDRDRLRGVVVLAQKLTCRAVLLVRGKHDSVKERGGARGGDLHTVRHGEERLAVRQTQEAERHQDHYERVRQRVQQAP